MARKNSDSEPGSGEFSFGKGLQPPESRGYVPTNRDKLRALYATDPADPESVVDFRKFERES